MVYMKDYREKLNKNFSNVTLRTVYTLRVTRIVLSCGTDFDTARQPSLFKHLFRVSRCTVQELKQ